jgi:sec-independent protein translocase protein TatC
MIEYSDPRQPKAVQIKRVPTILPIVSALPYPSVHRQYNEDLFESTKMTFGEHLDELRLVLIKSIVTLIVCVLIAFCFARNIVQYVQTPLKEALKEHYLSEAKKDYANQLAEEQTNGQSEGVDPAAAAEQLAAQKLISDELWIDRRELSKALGQTVPPQNDKSAASPPKSDARPVDSDLIKIRLYHSVDKDPRVRVVALDVAESFMVLIKAALMSGAVLASPFIFYFIWQFVAAGLYPHEQRYVKIFLPFSTCLFLAGAALAFFVVFKFVLRFLFMIAGLTGIEVEPRITEWISFVLILPIGFGLAFQLPLVMLFLERIGILSIATYLSNWRMSVLVIAFISMIFTPSDPYSMMLMMLPLIGLYFFGISLCKWMPRREAAFADDLG